MNIILNTMTLIHYCLSSPWKNIFKVIILSGIFCCILITLRIILVKDWMYLFLVWNLFLAGLPLLFAFILKYLLEGYQKMLFPKIILFSLWLLFLPNSPYIITDLVHLTRPRVTPFWLDGSIIFTSALTGLMMGLLSLYFIHEKISENFNQRITWFLISILIGLTSFGVYLGRVLRFNSWDLFTQPYTLFSNIVHSLVSFSAMSMTAVFSGMLLFIYILIYNLLEKKY